MDEMKRMKQVKETAKYRVWDKEYRMMNDDVYFSSNNYAILLSGKPVRFITGGYPCPDGKMTVLDKSDILILMEYIGLVDKNKNRICKNH